MEFEYCAVNYNSSLGRFEAILCSVKDDGHTLIKYGNLLYLFAYLGEERWDFCQQVNTVSGDMYMFKREMEGEY
jgi:hypothetical protein